MLKAEQVPDEVVEAAARAIAVAEWGDDKMWDPFIKRAEEAIAAALNAWPGVSTGPNIYGRQDAVMHLPLPPQEGE